MDLWQAFVLGSVQGLTEFLPVSSSGHLVLAETMFGLQVEELLVFDVVLHAGTLLALLVYFWGDLWKMLMSLFRWSDDSLRSSRIQLGFLMVATLPVVLLAPFMKDWLQASFRSADSVIMMLGLTAVLLGTAELLGKKTKGMVQKFSVALLMGCFQVLALIPGVSRSGSTMVGGLLGGLKREAAARFAFLMAVPAIAGATVFLAKDVLELGAEQVSVGALALGFVSSALVSFACMWGMLQYLRKQSLWVFVAYLLLVVLGYLTYGLAVMNPL